MSWPLLRISAEPDTPVAPVTVAPSAGVEIVTTGACATAGCAPGAARTASGPRPQHRRCAASSRLDCALGQVGTDHEALLGRALWMTGREREVVLARGIRDHALVGRKHDEGVGRVTSAVRYFVRAAADRRLENDDVTLGETVELRERLAVGGAMAGDRDVAVLARQRRRRVVPSSGFERSRGDALDNNDVDAELRDLDPRERVADSEFRRWYAFRSGLASCVSFFAWIRPCSKFV